MSITVKTSISTTPPNMHARPPAAEPESKIQPQSVSLFFSLPNNNMFNISRKFASV